MAVSTGDRCFLDFSDSRSPVRGSGSAHSEIPVEPGLEGELYVVGRLPEQVLG